jgi:hypothetical protein
MLSADGDPSEARRVRVRVVHGNLAFTRHPVAVGHYSGDTIVSAEKHLDRALNAALSHRLHLGLYPGPIGTNAVFTNPRLTRDRYARPGGAIVVGLGTVGQLSASLLTRSFSRALLEFVLERRKCQPALPGDDGVPGIGVAALLIGTGAGGMSVSSSALSLVRGAQGANLALGAARQPEWISDLEVIELYEDRAIVALEALLRLAGRSGLGEGFTLAPELGKRDGGLHRVSYDDDAPEWWHRLQVKGAAENGESSAGLRFAAVTRRARTEVRLLPTQRTIVDRLIQEASETTRNDAGIGRTLFDLLLPNELKESALDTDNLVLLLDEESARYPWELLQIDEKGTRIPFVHNRGLLRQLESKEFRGDVRGSVEMTALVIGDPVSPFAELEGAQREAHAVAEALAPAFSVTKKVRATSQDVITALFERPYKLLHLAGHGVYRYTAPGARRCDGCGREVSGEERPGGRAADTVTGMVIGDGVFLTPGEVQQMTIVPDLVFINCCHLGLVEPGKTDATPQERAFPQLAANLATQFIGMGVRAVIAAGWAVDDGAATTFASTFYRRMLSGVAFGDAVKEARKATRDAFEHSNTWGAYQCYGDPDFRLVLEGQRAGAAGTPPTFLSKAQALRDIGNIAARLKTQSQGSGQEEIDRLDGIVVALEARKWLGTGAVAAALGRAYGEAGLLDRAVEYYSSALGSEDGAITLKDVEQCANLMGRLAVQQWSRNGSSPEVTSQSTETIARAIHILKDLLGGLSTALGGSAGERFTSERLALLGSAYKRLAWVDRDGRAAALLGMARYYRLAADRARARGLGTAYPLLNVRWAELAMRWQGVAGAGEVLADLAGDLAAVREELAQETSEGPRFWQDSLRVDCELLETVHAGPLTRDRVGRFADEYLRRREYASAREFASICDHLDFLVVMAEPVADMAPLLAELRKRVEPAGS